MRLNAEARATVVHVLNEWLKQREDAALLAVAEARSAADTGERHSLDDVAREFGVDLRPDTSVSPVTDDMVDKAARAHAENDGYDWPEVSAFWQERYRRFARVILSAALAGCTVAPDSVPTGDSVDGERYWWTALSTIAVGLNLADKPFVRIDGEFFDVDEVEADALARLTAAREARRLAGGSQVGDQHGD